MRTTFIKLSEVTGQGDFGLVHDELDGQPGEDDQPTQAAAPAQITRPVFVNVDMIRSFTSRRDDKPGTRIVYKSGAGVPVLESPDEVMAAIAAASVA